MRERQLWTAFIASPDPDQPKSQSVWRDEGAVTCLSSFMLSAESHGESCVGWNLEGTMCDVCLAQTNNALTSSRSSWPLYPNLWFYVHLPYDAIRQSNLIWKSIQPSILLFYPEFNLTICLKFAFHWIHLHQILVWYIRISLALYVYVYVHLHAHLYKCNNQLPTL